MSITSMVFPLPGGPNNKIPRTGARRPVNIYFKTGCLHVRSLFQYTSGRRTGKMTASSNARLAAS